MQESLHLLQVPAQELRQLIHQELTQNPALEEDLSPPSLEEVLSSSSADEFDPDISELSRMDEEWNEYYAQSDLDNSSPGEANRAHQWVLDSLTESITLREHLMEQLSFADLPRVLSELVANLIDSLNDDGFLTTNLTSLREELGGTEEDWEAALQHLRSFDPAGVGATDLRDCLLLQLSRMGQTGSLAWRIVDQCLADLGRRRYQQIATDLDVSVAQVAAAAESISKLDPHPGRSFSSTPGAAYVVPDVIVEKEGDGWAVMMNNREIPHLRISNSCKDLIAEDMGREEKSYVREKIRGGKAFIRAIQQRQETILRISKEIVARQDGFFQSGPSALRPLNMAAIAQAIGVHKTTVSRAVSGKFIETPHGIFELKYFFSSGYETAEGGALSSTSVKKHLLELIQSEDLQTPLSDQDLVEVFAKSGIPIARRTIAKYREELHILPSHQRRSR